MVLATEDGEADDGLTLEEPTDHQQQVTLLKLQSTKGVPTASDGVDSLSTSSFQQWTGRMQFATIQPTNSAQETSGKEALQTSLEPQIP